MPLTNERLAGARGSGGHRNLGGLASGLELRDPWIKEWFKLISFSLGFKKLYQPPPCLHAWNRHIILLSGSSDIQFFA